MRSVGLSEKWTGVTVGSLCAGVTGRVLIIPERVILYPLAGNEGYAASCC